MKSAEYYAERLYTQAIMDPSVNGTDLDAVSAYVREEAEKLPEPTTADFKRATVYSSTVIGSPQELSDTPPNR